MCSQCNKCSPFLFHLLQPHPPQFAAFAAPSHLPPPFPIIAAFTPSTSPKVAQCACYAAPSLPFFPTTLCRHLSPYITIVHSPLLHGGNCSNLQLLQLPDTALHTVHPPVCSTQLHERRTANLPLVMYSPSPATPALPSPTSTMCSTHHFSC